ncbi:MAG: nicotinate (nicotinamide) nucleotide adenylyltransferase [Caldisericia bacterium]|nr:nicotinate (nicotinamide) nucleotide adenylyltransferase [Caldisericia bacterium]MDD4614538.1 nicotinate (nicotinamide) nucleotide adenylyltransferase [Caldisericia bacterium]
MVLKKRSIGFFGGSFNPIHMGHLIAAEYAREFFSLDSIYFIPTWISPHKHEVSLAPPSHRVEMIKLAIQDNTSFSILQCDIQRQCPTYTMDTLRDISGLFPQSHFAYHFIVGSDAIQKLPTWKSPDQILTYTDFLVAQRERSSTEEDWLPTLIEKMPEVTHKIHFFPMPTIGISSSLIRDRIFQKKTIQYLVPATVASYIGINNLYKEDCYRKN